jgi:hypothetical protein
MKLVNFMEDPSVCKAFKEWTNCPTLFSHPDDKRYFYKFVACTVHYVKHIPFVRREEAWKTVDISVFTNNFSLKFSELKNNNPMEFEKILHKVLVTFEMLIDYEQVNDSILWFNQMRDNEKYLRESA